MPAQARRAGLLATWVTKQTPVYCLHFTPRNLLLGAGALMMARRTRA